MNSQSYSGKLRFLSFGSLLFFILGIVVYNIITLPEKPSLGYISADGARTTVPDRTGFINASLKQNSVGLMTGTEPESPMTRTVHVQSGDTISSILGRENISKNDVEQMVDSFLKVFNPRYVKTGQKITFVYDDPSMTTLLGFSLEVNNETEVLVEKKKDGTFSSRISNKPLVRKLLRVDGTIDTTLYSSAIEAGLPISILHEMIYAYSFDIDFQRDIRPKDSYSIAYEVFCDTEGNVIRNGEIRYAVLTVRGQDWKIFSYTDIYGDTDFYDEAGKSVRKQLLRTPVDIPRITSGYGMRVHPIYGYDKMHKGLDFGAPQGTPIRAAGDGYVSSILYNEVYGNHVIMSHPNEYSTLYAHMVSVRRGLTKGQKVKQGDTIGYVGSTGLTTGPHLHYEVRHRGEQINPSRVKFPPGKHLKGVDLARFVMKKAEYEIAFRNLGIFSVSLGNSGTAIN